MHVKIDRGNDIDAELYNAIGLVIYGDPGTEGAETLDEAYATLTQCFPASERPLYWFYKGGNHIAVHSHRHEKRIALISV